MRRKISGFTIIELLLVIVIAGVVTAIVIPKVRDILRDHKGDLKEIVATSKEIVGAKTDGSSGIQLITREGDFGCIEGKRTVIIDEQLYYLAVIDKWDDLIPVQCE